MKIVVAPNAFKDSLSAKQAAKAITEGILRAAPDAEAMSIPVADGGDGLFDVFHSVFGGEVIRKTVPGPLFDEIEADYLYIPDTATAVIEMARASGLALLNESERRAGRTTTLGTGMLCRDALDRGATRIIVGLGGSATNDGGVGVLTALGGKLLDQDGKEITPIGDNLARITAIDLSGLPAINGITWDAVCDVDNPLTGHTGAAAVYGSQKGASPEEIRRLDQGLLNLAKRSRECLNIDHSMTPGAGAAGGLGFGLATFLGASLRAGVEVVLDMVGLNDALEDADLVITAEGRVDAQTAFGKGPAGVGLRAKQFEIPCIVIAGSINGDISTLHGMGVNACFSLCPGPISLNDAIDNAAIHLANSAEQVTRFFLGIKNHCTFHQ